MAECVADSVADSDTASSKRVRTEQPPRTGRVVSHKAWWKMATKVDLKWTFIHIVLVKGVLYLLASLHIQRSSSFEQ